MPLHTHVHVDGPLSNFAVEYQNEDFVAQEISPFVPVMKKSDLYYEYTQADKFSLPETIRGPKDYANEVDWSTSTSTYTCIDHALRHFLPDSIVANSDIGVNPRQRSVNLLADLLLLQYEKAIATMVTTAGNYGSDYKVTLTGGDQWSSYSTSDPLGNIETARDACFVSPNVCLMGYDVWVKLKHHPQLLDRVKGGATNAQVAEVSRQLVAELFEVDKVIVGKAKYNSSNPAQTASYSRVWGDYCLLAYVEPQASLEGVSAFKTFRWVQQSTDEVYQTKTYREEAKGGGGEWIEVETSYDEVMVCSDVAYLISDLVA